MYSLLQFLHLIDARVPHRKFNHCLTFADRSQTSVVWRSISSTVASVYRGLLADPAYCIESDVRVIASHLSFSLHLIPVLSYRSHLLEQVYYLCLCRLFLTPSHLIMRITTCDLPARPILFAV